MSELGYTNKTKIGNWSEEQEQEKARLKEYLKKKEKGLLTTQQLASYSEKVSLADCKDGVLRDGDYLILCSSQNKGVLAIDLGTELAGPPSRYAASSSPSFLPCARNVVVVSRALGSPNTGPVILYGDKIVISTTPYLNSATKIRHDKLSLSSQLITPVAFAKYSRHQEVAFSSDPPSSYANHWQILYHDPKQRMEAEGSPVQVGKPLIISHCKTNAHLGSGAVSYINDFGTENEVFARTLLDQHKIEQPENLWSFEDTSMRDL